MGLHPRLQFDFDGRTNAVPNLKKRSKLSRVLVVGDEDELKRFLSKALHIGEFSLHHADNAHAALAAAREVQPDILLIDMGVQDLDGVEVIRRIREWSQVPIIIL